MESWVLTPQFPHDLNRQEERHRMTLAALADVDAGRVIDDQSVQAWADSLSTDRPLPPPMA